MPTIKASKSSNNVKVHRGNELRKNYDGIDHSVGCNDIKEYYKDQNKWKLDKYSYESLRRFIRSKKIEIRKRLKLNKSQEVQIPRI